MTFTPTCLERAYQLAEGGSCRNKTDIAAILQREGFMDVRGQLHGQSVTSALQTRCRASFGAVVPV